MAQEFFVAGTPVIAFKTGGLKDTVQVGAAGCWAVVCRVGGGVISFGTQEFRLDTLAGNGFLFESHSYGDFVGVVKRAMDVFRQPAMCAAPPRVRAHVEDCLRRAIISRVCGVRAQVCNTASQLRGQRY